MKRITSYLLVFLIFTLVMTGCTENGNDLPIASDNKGQVSSDILLHENSDVTVIHEESADYSIELSYPSANHNSDEEIPAVLAINNTSESGGVYSANVYFRNLNGKPILEIMNFYDCDVVVVRLPFAENGKILHELLFFYFDNITLQPLGENRFFPVISADSIIECSTENNSFSFTDINGNTEAYTVASEKYNNETAYYLRSAEYTQKLIENTHSTEFGELNFSYIVYEQSNENSIISPHNYVKITRDNGSTSECEVINPVYQPELSFDGLAKICSQIEFEVIELKDFGIAAVRVPVDSTGNGIVTHMASLFYFDSISFLPLERGVFTPEIPADSEFKTDMDKNCFSITFVDGSTSWYTVDTFSKIIAETSYVGITKVER